MTVTPDTRAAVLSRMVSQAPGQKLGRTQVMKLFYFLQELKGVPLGYDFRLFTYGPFDSEVLGDLSTACGLEQVAEKVVTYPRGYGYEITPMQEGEALSRVLERTNPDLTQKVDEVVREFGHLGAGELELRSTILFADRELGESGTPVTESELASRVRRIKPHFDDTTILRRVREMREQGWLRALTNPA